MEIRIESVNKDHSHSWVRISHGLNKLVTDLIDREYDEQECKEWDELAKEDHTCKLTPEERRRYKGQWYLTLNKAGKNGPTNLRSDYRAAVLMKNRLHHESGEPIEGPIHPGQQRRTQQGQEVFSEDYFSGAPVDQHTGWEYWLSSTSSSWWYASEWSWEVRSQIFFCSDLFFVTVGFVYS